MNWHRIELALGVALPLVAAAVASLYALDHAPSAHHARSDRPALMRTINAQSRDSLTGPGWLRDAMRTRPTRNLG